MKGIITGGSSRWIKGGGQLGAGSNLWYRQNSKLHGFNPLFLGDGPKFTFEKKWTTKNNSFLGALGGQKTWWPPSWALGGAMTGLLPPWIRQWISLHFTGAWPDLIWWPGLWWPRVKEPPQCVSCYFSQLSKPCRAAGHHFPLIC